METVLRELNMQIEEIQKALREEKLDGWLFFDHHQRDPLAYRILGLSAGRVVTRRWYYLIPAQGEPKGLVHAIESGVLAGLPGHLQIYSSWADSVRWAPCAAHRLPSRRDAIFPHLRHPLRLAWWMAARWNLCAALGVEVVSSAKLDPAFEARWTAGSRCEMHLEAGRRVDRVRAEAFADDPRSACERRRTHHGIRK